jgi:predicted transcriptional regulator YheO
MHTEAELMLAVGRLEGKVDVILQMQRLHEEQLKNHEDRLRELEHSRSFSMGIAAAVGAGVSLCLNFAIKVFT